MALPSLFDRGLAFDNTHATGFSARPQASVAAVILACSLHTLAAHAKTEPPTAEVASAAVQSVLQLNAGMMPIYDAALTKFRHEFLAEHPVILGLFSGAGGKFVLYRPNAQPLEAPNVPLAYQLAKSVGHTAVALYEVVYPYVRDPRADRGWMPAMTMMRDQITKALANLDTLPLPGPDQAVLRAALRLEQSFAEQCLKVGFFTAKDIEVFARGMKPHIKQLGVISATAQVDHWVGVLSGWKTLLGADWGKTYAVSNTMYVTRQNNILFTILAQFMGTEAINRRLLLFETTSFTTTPNDMLNLLSRIINDRQLGQTFFGDYMLMDSELVGSAARDALGRSMQRLGQPMVVPDYAHFNSNEWPWHTNPKFGDGPRTMEETAN